MSIAKQVQEDLVRAMKAKDSARLGALRLVKSALTNKQIELRRPLSEDEEHQVLQTLVKQRNEAIEMYEKAGRDELVAKEIAERDLIRGYLPEEVSGEEIEQVVAEVISELDASSPRDIGAVMRESLARLRASGKTVDGKAVNAAVRAKLS